MKHIEFDERWISNIIGEDYKSWEICDMNSSPFRSSARVFIKSPTGTGKTSFILDKLLPYAAEKRRNILYLGNRIALEKQIKNAVKKKLIPISIPEPHQYYDEEQKEIDAMMYQDQDSGIIVYILNYQSYFSYIKGISDKRIRNEPIYYVIFDEVHFFIEDALFNSRTAMIYDDLIDRFTNSVMIFMSATIDDFEDIYMSTIEDRVPNHPHQQIYNHFYKENNIKYINSFSSAKYNPYIFQKDDEIIRNIAVSSPNEKWLIFVPSINNGEKLKKSIRNGTDKTVEFLDASKKNTDDWDQIINHSSFEKDVLISTKVMDNGVNIIDSSVKHIVLPFGYKADFLQMLGRRRFENDQEEVNLYIRQPTIQNLNSLLAQLNRQKLYIEKFENYSKYSDYMTSMMSNMFSNCDKSINNLFYINYRRNLVVNKLAKIKINYMIEFYQEIIDNYKNAEFLHNVIEEWLGKSCASIIKYINTPNSNTLNEFLEEFLNKPINENEHERFYAGFLQLYKVQCMKRFGDNSEMLDKALNIRKGKTQRKATMNKSLAILNLPYEIKKENCCWVLRKVE